MTGNANTKPLSAGMAKYSVRSLLGLTTLCAVLLGFWKAFVYEPPTHKFPLYEKAPATRRLATKVGPNTVAIRSVTRNRPDGSVDAELGNGKAAVRSVPGKALLASCAAWLDVVQFELHPGPDRVEIIEARIFDHASRTLLSQADPAFGWQVVEPNLLQVYGLGKEVPTLLDVWLRVHSYRESDRAFTIPPTAGATLPMPGGTLTLSEVQNGFAGWNSHTGFAPASSESDAGSAIVLAWDGDWQDQPYQIAAVSVHGEKQFADRYLNFGTSGDPRQLVLFDLPLDEIESIEIRPDRGRHRFFFEAVQLPSAAGRSFSSPPAARVQIGGGETDAVVSELAPLRVRLATLQGSRATGSISNSNTSQILLRTTPQDREQAFTLIHHVQGMRRLPLLFRFQDSETGNVVPEAAFSPRGTYGASGANREASARTFMTPLNRVEAVELTVTTPP